MHSDELKWTEPNDTPVEGTLVGGLVDPEARAEFDAGAKLGRYVVLSHMGAGGMGVVYAAYDPELDRRIALKLMHQRGDDEAEAERASRRLLHEAKAMAQLSHPNVITVHDVGTIDGRVFIAMEFVEGVPLSRWMREPGRNWRAILDAFIKAGRGLEAAHAVGLVHRDFKPDNVLVGTDGRVRVLDFGLARRIDGEPGEKRDREAGTPAYMSPEQHLGKLLDHRADQFSFCVALYEALYGSLPFAAKTRFELALAVTDGRVGPAPKRAAVPNWVRWALLRGLDPDPEGRWPDIGSLLAALSRDPYRKLRSAGVWGLSSLVVLALVFAVVKASGGAPEQCTSGESDLAEVWNDERAEAVGAAFARVEQPWAVRAGEDAQARFDAWASAWTEMHRSTCEATIDGAQSEELLDRRMLCLQGRLAEFDELLEVVTGGEVETLTRIGEAVLELPKLDSCTAAAINEGGPEQARSPEERETVEQLERDLARARSLELTGAVEDAGEIAEAAVSAARELGDQRLLASALLTRAQIAVARDDFSRAKALLEEGELAAERGEADQLRARVLVALARVEAEAGRGEAVERRVLQALSVLDRVGASEVQYAELAGIRALGQLALGQPDQAKGLLRATIDGLAEVDPRPGEVARLHFDLGLVHMALGELDAARSELELASVQWGEHYGPQHPAIGEALLELARIDQRQGRLAQAFGKYEEARALFEQALGSACLDAGRASAGAAESLAGLGRVDEALVGLERARTIFEAHGDIAAADLAEISLAEGLALRSLGRLGEAARAFERAAATWDRPRLHGHDDRLPSQSRARVEFAELALELQQVERAREAASAVMRLLESLTRGDPDRDEALLARARFVWARARAHTLADGEPVPETVRELAEQARAELEQLGDTQRVAEIDAWLEGPD